jgi:hypothetical protein
MATFRKYGGTNYSPISNIVRHNILNSKNSSFNTSGLYNSKETYLSHVDMSGNSLLHVGNIFFQDGTSLSSGTAINPGLQQVLTNGSSAGGLSMTNVGGITYSGGTIQTSAYTGGPAGTYQYATLTLGNDGQITNIISNTSTTEGLAVVLTKSGDGGGKDMTNIDKMTNIGDITQNANKIITQSGTTGTNNTLKATTFIGDITQNTDKIITQSGTRANIFKDTSFEGNITQVDNKTIVQIGTNGSNTFRDTSFNGNISVNNIFFSNGKQQNTSYTGWQPNVDTCYNSATLKFNTDGKIIDVIDNSLSPYGLENVLTKNGDGGGKNMTNIGDITQQSNKIITQSGSDETNNTLKATQFSGNITQSSGLNTLKTTTFDGNIIQSSGSNTLNGTTFSSVCKYASSIELGDNNDIPNVAYVNQIASGLKPTYLCNCATTGPILFTGITVPFKVDGYTVLNDDRVLVKSQSATTANENTNNGYNGIYVYNEPAGELTRASDCEPGDDLTNQYTFIQNGDLNGQKLFFQINVVTSFNPPLSGTDTLQYELFSSLNYAVGQGLELTGNSPTTLQVKSNLNFLQDVSINNKLDVIGSSSLKDTSFNGNITQTGGTIVQIGSGSNKLNDTSFNGICTYSKPYNLSDFVHDDDIPNKKYVDTVSNITGSLGQGLEYKDPSFQVKSNLNFLKEVKINRGKAPEQETGHLILSNDLSGVTILYQGGKNLVFDNNSNTAEYYESSFKFACNNLGSNDLQTVPLLFNSSLFKIDVSNNLQGYPPVIYQACNNSHYNYLKIGHNFTGNIWMTDVSGVRRQISTSYLNVYDISDVSIFNNSKVTQIYQAEKQLLFDNNSTTDNLGITFGFYCNNVGDGSKQTRPLSFNSSSFNVDLSNNSGGPPVKYLAYNNSIYGSSSIGHNFTGNCYFNNNIQLNTSNSYIQFPDGTKQYNAPFGEREPLTLTSNKTLSTSELLLYGTFILHSYLNILTLPNVSAKYQFAVLNSRPSDNITINSENPMYYNLFVTGDEQLSFTLKPYCSGIFTSCYDEVIETWIWFITGYTV